jgi:hypothetical protein
LPLTKKREEREKKERKERERREREIERERKPSLHGCAPPSNGIIAPGAHSSSMVKVRGHKGQLPTLAKKSGHPHNPFVELD